VTFKAVGRETAEQAFRQRAAFLAEALSQFPADAVALSALFDLAVSAAVAVTFDPSTARLLFEANCQEYECMLHAGARQPRVTH
jgi:hypothetical protein